MPKGLRIVSYGGLGRLGRLPELEVVPCHFSALPDLFARRRLPGDVALIQVAPPDDRGRCSLGVGVDYLYDALAHARLVIAEVNDHCPRTAGMSVAWDQIDVAVHSSRPLVQAPPVSPGPIEERIAANVAAIVEDGDTIQLGVGALPEAIMAALRGHRDLGFHSGMISDGVLALIEAGAVTGARKPADRRLMVTGAALGSSSLFEALPRHEEIMFFPVSYTHAPATLARVGSTRRDQQRRRDRPQRPGQRRDRQRSAVGRSRAARLTSCGPPRSAAANRSSRFPPSGSATSSVGL